MRISILIALGAVAASAGSANAQTVTNESGKVQLKDIPNIGPLFRAPITPSPFGKSSLFGPDMPPAPERDAIHKDKLKLSVFKSSKGDIFQIEVAGQSRAAVLKKITDVMGVRAVIDPALEKNFEITQVFRGLSWDDLLGSVNYGIEMVKSPAGTYFFADKPIGFAFVPSHYSSELGDFIDPRTNLRITNLRITNLRITNLRILMPDGRSKPMNNFGIPVKPLKPHPDWQKREFNGRDFYFIPVPSNEKSPEPEKSK